MARELVMEHIPADQLDRGFPLKEGEKVVYVEPSASGWYRVLVERDVVAH